MVTLTVAVHCDTAGTSEVDEWQGEGRREESSGRPFSWWMVATGDGVLLLVDGGLLVDGVLLLVDSGLLLVDGGQSGWWPSPGG